MANAAEFDGSRSSFGRWLFAVAVLVGLTYWTFDPGIRHDAGGLVPEDPRQNSATGPGSWEFKGHHFRALADFYVRALVLHKESYWFDRGSKVSPLDLALGWGPMSDQSIVDKLSITQGGRWFQWSPAGRELPIPAQEIISHSANMHLIPANPEIERQLGAVRRGSIVAIEGQFVLVEGSDGYRWKSSLSRTDTAGGACELVWVTGVSVQH